MVFLMRVAYSLSSLLYPMNFPKILEFFKYNHFSGGYRLVGYTKVVTDKMTFFLVYKGRKWCENVDPNVFYH